LYANLISFTPYLGGFLDTATPSPSSPNANTSENTTGSGGAYTGTPDQFDVMSRLVRANALLPFALFLVLTVSLFATKILWIIFGPIVRAVMGVCCARQDKAEDMAPFSTLALPGNARFDDPATNPNDKLSGLRSYRLEDNPEYMMLFPEVLDGLKSYKMRKTFKA
jgi:DNA-directed RNA polymerase II subunit RPB7